jgi:DNA-binding response OmpR family regulator
MNVLLLEDDADLANTTLKTLDMGGVKGIPTHILNLNANIKLYKPELVITDYVLEYNITGDEVCQLIKTNSDTADLPVILMSDAHDLEDASLKCTPDAVIGKPFDINEFNTIVKKVLVNG